MLMRFFVVLCCATNAQAADPGRRSFLGGLSAVVGTVATAAPEAPMSPLASAPATLSFEALQANGIVGFRRMQFLSLILSNGFRYSYAESNHLGLGLSCEEEDILLDYFRQNPSGRAERDPDLDAYELARERMPPVVKGIKGSADRGLPVSEAAIRELQALQKLIAGLKARVNQQPWGSWDWGTVFGQRLAEAEARLARRLKIPVGEVFQATDVALNSGLVSGGNPHPLLQSLQNPLFYNQYQAYSDDFLAALDEELAPFAPNFARYVRHINTAIEADIISNALTFNLKVHVDRYQANPILKFSFRAAPAGRFDLRPEDLLPRYAEALNGFLAIQRRINLLPSSPFQRISLAAVTSLISELTEEGQSLPRRLQAYNETQGRDVQIPRPWNDPYWRAPLDDGLQAARLARSGSRGLGLDGWDPDFLLDRSSAPSVSLAPNEKMMFLGAKSCAGIFASK